MVVLMFRIVSRDGGNGRGTRCRRRKREQKDWEHEDWEIVGGWLCAREQQQQQQHDGDDDGDDDVSRWVRADSTNVPIHTHGCIIVDV